jgi:hypothetical protein
MVYPVRYELRAFTERSKGRWAQVKSLTMLEGNPHDVAIQVWKLTHVPHPYRVVVVDLAAGRGHLAPVVTYEELVRRSQERRAIL